MRDIAIEEQQLANQYADGISFDNMVFELNGNEEVPGTIQRLKAGLQQSISTKSDLTEVDLNDLRSDLDKDITNLAANQEKLTNANEQVSFKQLYESISQLQQSSPDQCLACQTLLDQVAVNPYFYASKELEKLRHLALLQEEEKKLKRNIQISLFKLSEIINICLKFLPQENSLQFSGMALPK